MTRPDNLVFAAAQTGLLIALAGCSSGAEISGDRAAGKALREAFEQHYANCSGRWTTAFGGGEGILPGTTRPLGYRQITNPAFAINKSVLTDAQKLNGVTFDGSAKFGKHMSDRRYQSNDYNRYHLTWTTWGDASTGSIRVQQRNGAWHFGDSLDFQGAAPDCSQVPPG